eukprot:scaffold24723_cov131-Isochrysis_galbana.AAC.3
MSSSSSASSHSSSSASSRCSFASSSLSCRTRCSLADSSASSPPWEQRGGATERRAGVGHQPRGVMTSPHNGAARRSTASIGSAVSRYKLQQQ